jgi:hypothetical protein
VTEPANLDAASLDGACGIKVHAKDLRGHDASIIAPFGSIVGCVCMLGIAAECQSLGGASP